MKQDYLLKFDPNKTRRDGRDAVALSLINSTVDFILNITSSQFLRMGEFEKRFILPER